MKKISAGMSAIALVLSVASPSYAQSVNRVATTVTGGACTQSVVDSTADVTDAPTMPSTSSLEHLWNYMAALAVADSNAATPPPPAKKRYTFKAPSPCAPVSVDCTLPQIGKCIKTECTDVNGNPLGDPVYQAACKNP